MGDENAVALTAAIERKTAEVAEAMLSVARGDSTMSHEVSRRMGHKEGLEEALALASGTGGSA